MGEAEKKRLKAELKIEKKKREAEQKRQKAELKIEKMRRVAGLPPEKPDAARGPGAHAHFADGVRGAIYVILGLSLIAAILLGQRDLVTSLDDLIDSLFLATAGKILLGIIGLAALIYGLRKLRIVR